MRKNVLLSIIVIISLFVITGCNSSSSGYSYETTQDLKNPSHFKWVSDYKDLTYEGSIKAKVFLKKENDKYYICSLKIGNGLLCITAFRNKDEYDEAENELRHACDEVGGHFNNNVSSICENKNDSCSISRNASGDFLGVTCTDDAMNIDCLSYENKIGCD